MMIRVLAKLNPPLHRLAGAEIRFLTWSLYTEEGDYELKDGLFEFFGRFNDRKVTAKLL
jgi:hypothetical protein